MSKRSSSSTPSPRKKKAKQDPTQSNLDAFFRVPSRPDDPETATRKGKGASSKAPRRSASPFNDDAAHHKAVAESSRQHSAVDTKSASTLNPSSSAQPMTAASTVSALSEVIDVDLLDDDERAPAPSAGSDEVEIPTSRSRSSPPRSARGKHVGEPASAAFLSSVESTAATAYQSLAVDPPFYDLDVIPWSDGAHAPYSFLAHTLSTLSETRSRIVILNTLTNSLRTISKYHPSSLLPALYLLSNSLSPPYSPLELGLGPSVISKAIQHVSGLTPAALKRLYNTTGDPGTSPIL